MSTTADDTRTRRQLADGCTDDCPCRGTAPDDAPDAPDDGSSSTIADVSPGDVIITPTGPRRIRKVYRHGTSPVVILHYVDGGLGRWSLTDRVSRRALTD